MNDTAKFYLFLVFVNVIGLTLNISAGFIPGAIFSFIMFLLTFFCFLATANVKGEN